MSNKWGLTEHGFLRPLYNDLLDAYETKAKELFGAKINLSVRSPLGIFLRLFAWFSGLVWQLAEDVYNAGYIDTASGVSLSRLGGHIGIRRASAQKATGEITITGDPGAVVPAGLLVQTSASIRFVTTSSVTIGAGGTVTAPIQAFDAGDAGNVAAAAIQTVVTPIATVTAITNAAATIGGRTRETDQQFRARYSASVDKPGGSNVDGIRAQILEVDGVLAAEVWENVTDDTDADGLLPHSVEAIVLGGVDADIADAIFASKAGGINTNGAVSVQLTDHSGRAQTVKFSRPTAVPIYVQISDLVTGADYGGFDTIRDAVIAHIGTAAGDDAIAGLDIGDTVYYNKLMCPVNDTPGVIDYTLQISKDGVTWQQTNITLTARQKAVTDADKVVLVSG